MTFHEDDPTTLTFEVTITHYPEPDEPSPAEQDIANAIYLGGIVNHCDGDVTVRQL